MFPVSYLLNNNEYINSESKNLFKNKRKVKLEILEQEMKCFCCDSTIQGSNKSISKQAHNISSVVCVYCKNFYRKNCLFYGLKCIGNKRFEKCHKVMHIDKMICSNIPEWIYKSFKNNRDKDYFKKNIYNIKWRCNKCNFLANNAYEFLQTNFCSNGKHYWVKEKGVHFKI